jgi:hypothetical protein
VELEATAALAQNNSASAAAMGVIGNMNSYSDLQTRKVRRGKHCCLPRRLAPRVKVHA